MKDMRDWSTNRVTMDATGKIVRPLVAAALALSIASLIACGHKRHKVKTARQPQPYHQPSVAVGTTEEGLASWYGIPYHGRPAADGEIYDMEQLVAAHRTMPFNTWIKVTNLSNGRSINVRVIDRGPFVRGRIVDLSKAAARQIEMLGPGVARVRLEVIAAPTDVPSDDYYGVQIGAFANYANAEKMRAGYESRYGFAKIEVKQGRVPLYRVLVGRESTEAAAERIANELSSNSVRVFVVRLDPKAPSYVPRVSQTSGAAAGGSGENTATARPLR
jgi:rare lipoprotein A